MEDLSSLSTRSMSNDKPVLFDIRSSKWTIGMTAFFATFTDGFLYGAIVPVFPSYLVEECGVPEDRVQFWLSLLLTVFGISNAAGSPFAAWAADGGARSKVFISGLTFALASTILLCIAKVPSIIALARVLQGLSTGIVYPLALSLIADAVPSDEIGSWVGFVFSGMSFGVLVSPFLGGFVYDSAGYLAVIATMFGILGIDIVLRLFMIDRKDALRWHADVQTVASDQTIEGAPSLAGSDDGSPWSRGRLARETEGVDEVLPHTTIPSEYSPLLPPRSEEPRSSSAHFFEKMDVLIRSRRLMAAVFGSTIQIFLLSAFDAILPRYVGQLFGWGATAAGAVFLTTECPCIFGAFFGALSDRFGCRQVALAGFAIATPGLVLLSLVDKDTVADQIFLCLFLTLVGIGLQLVLAPLAADMFDEVDVLIETYPVTFGKAGAYSQAYSICCAAMGLATAAGPILAGVLLEKSSWLITQSVMAILCALASLVVFRYIGRRHPSLKQARFEGFADGE